MKFLLLLLVSVTNQQALTDAKTYISQERRGNVRITLPGLAAGQQVRVKQIGLDWKYGAAIHAASHLDSSTYVARFLENFNAVSSGGPGYWIENERTRDVVTIQGLQRVVDFAVDHDLYLRGHNLIYERDQPSWVKQLSNSAMRTEISERIDYYTPLAFDEIDVYNESFNGGELGGSGTYFNRLEINGVASVYNETAAQTDARVFVNDYAALQGSHVEFADHIDRLEAAGATVEGIGLEYYSDGADADIPKNYRTAFDEFERFGLSQIVSEWGLFQTASPDSLRTAMTMAFGNQGVDGFYMWDWTDREEWSFADASVFYTVNGNTYTLTPTGKAWQDQLGIHDWDGDPSNGWRTDTTVSSTQNGFAFDGYWGDYEITIGPQVYPLKIQKGVTAYVIGATPGDFNLDGSVDAADYTVWRDSSGSMEDYLVWREAFHHAPTAAVPETIHLFLLVSLILLFFIRRLAHRRTGRRH